MADTYLNTASTIGNGGLGGVFDQLAQQIQAQRQADTLAAIYDGKPAPQGLLARLFGGGDQTSTPTQGATPVPGAAAAPASPSPNGLLDALQGGQPAGSMPISQSGSSQGAVPPIPPQPTPAPLAYAPTPAVAPAAPAQPSASAVPSMGVNHLPTVAALQGTPAGASVNGMFSSLESKFNLPQGFLAQTAQIESNGDPNAVSPTGAAGLFQFTKGTAAQYGLSNPMDPVASSYAAAKLAANNAATLTDALGRAPTGPEMYLAHQQGAGGAAALLSNPNARAGDIVEDRAVAVNGGDPSMTAGQFASMWESKFGSGVPALPQASQGQASPANPLGPAGIIGLRAAGQAQNSPYGGIDPNAFGGPQGGAPQGGPVLPSLASGAAPQFSPATPLQASSGTGSPTAQAIAAVHGPDAVNTYAPTAPAAAAAPAQAAITAAAGPAGGTSGAQPYGSVPLMIKGQMLTRQQAEDAPEALDIDHTDYDAAAAKAGIFPPAGQAPAAPSVAPMAQPAAPSTANALSPAGQISPPTQPVQPSPTTSDTIRRLLSNPLTMDLGKELWKSMLTKTPPAYQHIELPDGRVLAFNPGTGTASLIAQGAPNTDAIKNYQFAKSQGYAGTFTDYQSDQQKADKAQLVDVPQPDGTVQKMWLAPGQAPTTATAPVGSPYTKPQGRDASLPQVAQQRQQLMQSQGRDLNDPAVQNYIATGKFEQPPMSATTQKAIDASDRGLDNLYHARDVLQNLQTINDQTPGGAKVGWEQSVQRNAPGFMVPQAVTDDAVNATDFDKTVQEQMLPRLKEYFGGRPAFAADQQMLKVTPTTQMSPAERAPLLTNMANRVGQLIQEEEARNTNLRNGSFYKPGGSPTMGQQPQPQAQTGAAARQTQASPAGRVQVNSAADYNALPSGTRFLDPNGVARIKP